MIALHALHAFTLAALTAASPRPATSPARTAEPLIVRGQLLTMTDEYLVFTTGDAVRLDADTRIAPHLRLGETIRVRLDPTARRARSVEPAQENLTAKDIAVGLLPPEYIAISPGSARSAHDASTTQRARIVTVTFVVHTPDDTPVNDDVYLSTDRSNFSPAELKMNRIDAHRWSVTLPLVTGTQLHYQYTRGNYATVERDASGGSLPPHAADAREGLRTNDTVARWADTS
jgi:hypothetical protein